MNKAPFISSYYDEMLDTLHGPDARAPLGLAQLVTALDDERMALLSAQAPPPGTPSGSGGMRRGTAARVRQGRLEEAGPTKARQRRDLKTGNESPCAGSDGKEGESSLFSTASICACGATA
jgi:hypothetical protein